MILDTTLVAKAKNGDKDAFSELYSLFYKELYKTAFYTLGNSHDAEDVVSETFVEGYRGISNLRDDTLFRAWIFKILSARCNRKIATYYKSRQTICFDDLPSVPLDEKSYENESDTKILLINALNKLTSDERKIISLFVINGYKINEIAYMLDIPQGTISSKIHRTLKKLRICFKRR